MKQYFGTDGIRGIPNKTLNEDLVSKIFSSVEKELSPASVAVILDTRSSSLELLSWICNGLSEKVEVVISQDNVQVKGPLGELNQSLTGDVKINKEDNVLTFQVNNESKFAKSMSGTLRALVNNMVTGVSAGFEKKLTLIGVGYKAQVQGNKVNLDLGFSHPIIHDLPEGITAQAASPTELVIKGSNKQVVGQVAAEIRGYRPPEPYKGKGVRYKGEQITLKETKKAV